MSQISTPSIDRLKKAVEVAEQIEKLQSDLAAILGNHTAVSAAPAAKAAKVAKVAAIKPAGKGRRTMSPEARERIAAAQRARWAKSRGGAVVKPVVAAKAKSGKRTLSPEAREKIAAAARRRWAAFKKK
jgi:hypothetical protein